MHLDPVTFNPIGKVRCDFGQPGDPKDMRNALSTLMVDPQYAEALEGLDRFSHLLVIYHIHQTLGYDLKVHPMGDESLPKRGLFATRTPRRPNPVGLTVVKLLHIEGCQIAVTGLDALNESPILDIKPYEEHFDSPWGIEAEKDPNYRPQDG